MRDKGNKVIGRGLGALLSDNDDTNNASSIAEISISDIDPNPNQPRKEFDGVAISELSDSIKSIGIVQPITVQKKDNGRYFIIAGERRFRAAVKAGIKTLPAYIKDIPQSDIMELALVENIQRQDLNAIEIALSLDSIMRQKKMTHEQISQTIGKNRATITNYIRLLKLPAEIQLGITKRLISMGHAKALLSVDDHKTQIAIYKKIVKKGLSVREVENLIKENKSQKKDSQQKANSVINDAFAVLSDMLSNTFSTKVSIEQNNKGRGKLTIPFSNEEELERILHILEKLQH